MATPLALRAIPSLPHKKFTEPEKHWHAKSFCLV